MNKELEDNTDSSLYYLVSTRNMFNVKYIGITSKTLLYRLKKHIYDCKGKNTYKDRWIKKEIDNGFKIEIILITNQIKYSKAKELEIQYIKEAKEVGFMLVNTSEGGDGYLGKHSKDHHKKIADAKRGKKWSMESRKRLSDAQKGKVLSINHRLNIGRSGKGRITREDTKEKMRIKATGRKLSQETLEILRKANTGRIKTKEETRKRLEKIWIPVVKLSNNNKTETFMSSSHAEKQLNIDSSSIIAVCRGRRKTAGGFKWKYYDNEE